MEIIRAKKTHARDLAYLLNIAGEGIPEYLWQGMVEGEESALDFGEKRAAREEGGFSYTNAKVVVEEDILMGMIVSYRQPDPYDIEDLKDYPDIVQPLIELEAKAPGSWYINALATHEPFRGKGVAQSLMKDAELQAQADHCNTMSIIVASDNAPAKSLYEHLNFEPIARLPVVEYPGCIHGGDWVLMTKNI